MLTEYVQDTVRRANYEILEDDGAYYGEIPGFDGVWANASTLEDCRLELEKVLEGWIFLSLSKNFPIPTIDGNSLDVTPAT